MPIHHRHRWAFPLVAALALIIVSVSGAAGGDLDTSFGGDGIVTRRFFAGSSAEGIAIDALGRIVITGRVTRPNESTVVGVARVNTDGTRDLSFGGDGKVTTDVGDGGGQDVLVQPNGKIVVVGGTDWREDVPGEFFVLRYNADGTLDATFGRGGKRLTDFSRGGDIALGAALQPDGKIVAVGLAGRERDGKQFAIARYTRHGRLDRTFGGDGKVMTNFPHTDAFAEDVAVQPDGKIVVAGESGFLSGSLNPNFLLARYNGDGSLDSSFSGDGRLRTDFSQRADGALGVLIDAGGGIVVAGESYETINDPDFGPVHFDGNFALARYNADGNLDSSFGVGGRVMTDFDFGNPDSDEGAYALAIQSDGKIVAAGHMNFDDFALVRYDVGGTLDPSFGGDGIVLTPNRGIAAEVAVQSDGKIVAIGSTDPFVGRLTIARYANG
jgi:uncharacterized delta-60 repeat protein